MEARDNNVLELRGEALGTITNQSSVEEIFQNRTLRPILKLQNDLFIQVSHVGSLSSRVSCMLYVARYLLSGNCCLLHVVCCCISQSIVSFQSLENAPVAVEVFGSR